MRVGIIGCGLIGRKRALALGADDVLAACCDTNGASATAFSAEFGCSEFTDPNELLSHSDIDAVVVAVVNKYAKDIVIGCLKAGKHVLAEKPLGRNLSESAEIVSNVMHESSRALKRLRSRKHSYLVLKTGFNHRFHPAIRRAKEIADEGAIGKLMSIRAAYGHGGRPGMEKEWRASKELCGGGELLDQGVHLIDLIRWFGGEIVELTGTVTTQFWDMEVEDNAYAVVKTDAGVTAAFHVSWTNWKNVFTFEVFGSEGYLKVNGLGGSYGVESLDIGRRKKGGGSPDIETLEFPRADTSWKDEWTEFKSAILEGREPLGNGVDGLMANRVIEAIYQSDREKRTVAVEGLPHQTAVML